MGAAAASSTINEAAQASVVASGSTQPSSNATWAAEVSPTGGVVNMAPAGEEPAYPQRFVTAVGGLVEVPTTGNLGARPLITSLPVPGVCQCNLKRWLLSLQLSIQAERVIGYAWSAFKSVSSSSASHLELFQDHDGGFDLGPEFLSMHGVHSDSCHFSPCKQASEVYEMLLKNTSCAEAIQVAWMDTMSHEHEDCGRLFSQKVI
eukprot:scaffold103345_cov19-Tisochrysis_lutea.AAC.1